MIFCVVLLLLGFQTQIYAQKVNEQAGFSQGFIPAPQTAAIDDAWSLLHNPAGLAFIEGAQFVGGYQFEWGEHLKNHHTEGIVALSPISGLTLSIGGHLAVPSEVTVERPYPGELSLSIGAAFRTGRVFSFGVSGYKRREFATASDPFLFATGLQLHPVSWMALGASIHQVYGGFASPFMSRVGISIRPYREYLTIGLDNVFAPRVDDWSASFAASPSLSLKLNFGGLGVYAGAVVDDVSENGFNKIFISSGLQCDFEHMGVRALFGVQPTDRWYSGAHFRISSEKWPTISTRTSTWVSVSLSGEGTLTKDKQTWRDVLFPSIIHPAAILIALDNIKNDRSIEGVILRLHRLSIGFARANEIRNTLLSLKKAGKRVVVYFDSADEKEYFIASAADKIYMSPSGSISLDGFRTTLVYLSDLLKRFGIKAEAVIAGTHKTAPQQFLSSSPSDEEKEVVDAILDARFNTFAENIGTARELNKADVISMINLGEAVSTEAMRFKLVDQLLYEDQIKSHLPSKYQFVRIDDHYLGRVKKEERWSRAEEIAVIPISGTIVNGYVSPSFFPIFERTGARNVNKAIEEAKKDPRIKAIVLRINSPGGDALASDLIYHAVLEARHIKPVIISMADIAASGGYYIASAGTEIYADELTLTGSIGVFSLHVSVQELAEKYGVKAYEFNRGERPGPNLLRPYTQNEKNRAQDIVEWHYKQFKEAVSAGLNLAPEKVNAYAEGRVWTGQQALDRDLVHKLGGLPEAVKRAKELAEVSNYKQLNLRLISPVTGFARLFPSVKINSLAWLSIFYGTFIPDSAMTKMHELHSFDELLNRPLALAQTYVDVNESPSLQ